MDFLTIDIQRADRGLTASRLDDHARIFVAWYLENGSAQGALPMTVDSSHNPL
jgi:hypothetical protein